MMADLAALTPPLVVCIAFIVGVVLFLRHQLAPKRRAAAKFGTDAQANGGKSGNDAQANDAQANDGKSGNDAQGTRS